MLLPLSAALVLPGTALARECGIPDSNPLWVDFAGHDAPVPQKPGLTLAFTSGTVKPSEARAAGAATVFFDLNFNNRVGTPTVPADPATITDRADRLFDFAVSVTGCQTPWIALNELFGAQTPTPWTTTTAQYRANTLALVRRLAERGAKPAVTIANPPYTGGDAAQWWRDLASVAVLIRQVFFTSPNVPQLHALGPVRASRSMRAGMRSLVRRFTEIGIPANRVALELQFQSAPGTGGREGLQPRSKWLEIVKLEALAVRQVTQELKTHSIWSWGWATFSEAGIDRDKGEAVCVYLWVRDQNLCSGPGAAGPDFDPSLTVGQLNLPAGVLCTLPAGQIRSVAVDPLARAIGDRDIAASLVLERLVLQQEVELDARAVLAAELAFVDDHFRGNLSAYLAALQRIPLSRSAARGLLLDELRRDAVRARFTPARPGGRPDRRVPHHLRRPAGAPGRDGAAGRVARRPHPWARDRDVRAHPDLLSRAPRLRQDDPRADRGAPARRHRLSRHDPDRRGPSGDRGLAQPLRPRLRLRGVAREGRGTGARRGDLRRRPAADVGRSDARRPAAVRHGACRLKQSSTWSSTRPADCMKA